VANSENSLVIHTRASDFWNLECEYSYNACQWIVMPTQQSVLTLICADKILMSFPCSNPAGLNTLGYETDRTNKATNCKVFVTYVGSLGYWPKDEYQQGNYMYQYVAQWTQNTCYCMLVHNRDGTQGTIFISYCNTVYNYATCTDEVQFLLLRGGTQLTQY